MEMSVKKSLKEEACKSIELVEMTWSNLMGDVSEVEHELTNIICGLEALYETGKEKMEEWMKDEIRNILYHAYRGFFMNALLRKHIEDEAGIVNEAIDKLKKISNLHV
jgi:hypothetical protein